MTPIIVLVLAMGLAAASVLLAVQGRRLRAVRRQRDLLGVALDNAPGLIAIKDAGGRYLQANRAFSQFVGQDTGRIVGRRTVDFLPHGEIASVEAEEQQLLDQGGETMTERTFAGLSGGMVTLALRKRRIELPGIGPGLVVVGHDVSDMRQALAAAQAARADAEAAASAKAVFLATMSHEIRTPLNGVLGMGQLLARTRLDPDQQEYARAAAESGQALLAVINGILDFTRLESERVELERLPVDLRRLVHEVVRLMPDKAGSVEYLVDIDPALPRTVLGDAGRLRQVLLNLIGNAAKFTERGIIQVRLACSLAATGERLVLTVEDTGCGIPAEAMARLFQPFVQADAGITRRYGGSGLGLAISQRLASLMGGRITVTSAPGRGSCFTLGLPLQAVEERPGAPSPRPPAGTRILLALAPGPLADLLRRQLARAGLAVEVGDPDHPEARLAALAAAGTPAAALLVDRPQPSPGVGAPPLLRLAALAGREAAGDDGAVLVTKPVDEDALLAALAEAAGGRGVAPDRHRPAPSPAPAPQRIAARVLVADDDPVGRRLATLMLTGFGAEAVAVEDGNAALAAVAAGGFDLVLMDVHLPGIDGFAATAGIRALEAGGQAHLPVVALTASALAGDREACLKAGMDDYLAKPVSIEALGDVLRRWAVRRP